MSLSGSPIACCRHYNRNFAENLLLVFRTIPTTTEKKERTKSKWKEDEVRQWFLLRRTFTRKISADWYQNWTFFRDFECMELEMLYPDTTENWCCQYMLIKYDLHKAEWKSARTLTSYNGYSKRRFSENNRIWIECKTEIEIRNWIWTKNLSNCGFKWQMPKFKIGKHIFTIPQTDAHTNKQPHRWIVHANTACDEMKIKFLYWTFFRR